MRDATPTGEGSSPDCAPDEAFALLGDETRIAILRALWEVHEPFGDDASASGAAAISTRLAITPRNDPPYGSA
jgi:DNA-binding transcriptional ArsR family regulator